METLELVQKFENHHLQIMKKLDDTSTAVKSVEDRTNARLVEMEQKMARRPGAGVVAGQVAWGQTIVDSPEFKTFRDGGCRGLARIEVKTVSTIGSGSTLAGPMIGPEIILDPTILPRRKMTVRNLLGQGSTNSNSVWFPRQRARQNLSRAVSEGATKPQSDLTVDQVQSPVVTLAHVMQASRQAMDDSAALMSLIDGELRYGLAYTEEQQLLYGDGTGANLLGIIPQATAYSGAFSITGETAIDRLLLALVQAELALLPASGIVLNTADWGKLRSQKDSLGRYLLGDPAEQAAPMLWSLPVIVTPAIAEGHWLVGAFGLGAQIFDRMSVEVLISTEAGSNFTNNEITIRAENRLALCVKRPTAFITGTLP